VEITLIGLLMTGLLRSLSDERLFCRRCYRRSAMKDKNCCRSHSSANCRGQRWRRNITMPSVLHLT